MIESVIAQEATKKIAGKVVEKAAEQAIGYTSNKVEDSLRPQTDNPLSKWEKGTAMFLTGSLSDAALATKMEAAAHSACKFFDLPEPELVEGNSIGVLMDANIFMDKDQFYFNLNQFKDMKCLSFEDMSKIWAHECGHRILKPEQISVWSQELGADFFMGVRSEMLGLPSSEIEKVLASQPASSSHPYGKLRAQAIKEGREYVKECNLAKEPITVQGCKDAFLSSKLSKIPAPDSTTKQGFAAFVNDKSYHLEKAEKAQDNATYYSKEAEKATKNGDLSRAKDMQRKADNYESKVKEEKKSAEMSKLVDAQVSTESQTANEIKKECKKHSENYFGDDDKWKIEETDEGTVIEYDPINKAIIKGDTIKCRAGSVIGDGPMNEILNHPLANKIYIVDDASIYETDAMGRVTHVSSDRTRLYSNGLYRDKRHTPLQTKVRGKGVSGDDGGHLISAGTNGANEMINQVPMNKQLQRSGGAYRKFEEREEAAIEEGKEVFSERQLYYKGESMRPYKIVCTAIIDGEKIIKPFEQ